jgi:hypothetical protein
LSGGSIGAVASLAAPRQDRLDLPGKAGGRHGGRSDRHSRADEKQQVSEDHMQNRASDSKRVSA